MKLKIVFIDNLNSFPNKKDLTVWTTQENLKKLKLNQSDYVKVFSNVIFKKFEYITVINSIQIDSDFFSDDCVYISRLTIENPIVLEGDMLEIEPININSLSIAQNINLHVYGTMPKIDDFIIEEFKKAFVALNKLTFINQKNYLKIYSQREVYFAEVKNVTPNINKILVVNANTQLQFTFEEIQDEEINFNDIGGLEHISKKLKEIISLRTLYPNLLKQYNIYPPKGLLLYGPPGNGKTMLAKAVAKSMGSNFILIEGPQIINKYVGVAEEELRNKFNEASKFDQCIIFIDELDSIASDREKTTESHQQTLVATLLLCLDGISSNSNIFVIGATNRLNAVDKALRRPKRFDIEIEVPIPDFEARKQILSKHIDSSKPNFSHIEETFIPILAGLTNGFSGADIYALYREGFMESLRESDKSTLESFKIEQRHFISALNNITPTIFRDSLNIVEAKAWHDLLIESDTRNLLQNIHNNLNRSFNQKLFSERLGLFNIVIRGVPGTGKTTLIKSFASEFKYEIVDINLAHFSTLNDERNLIEIEHRFIKAKQSSPSIIHIYNYLNHELIFTYILNNINSLNSKNKILIFLEVDNKIVDLEQISNYKSFDTLIEIQTISDVKVMESLFEQNKMESLVSLNHFIKLSSGKGIGEINYIIKKILLNESCY